MTLAFPSGPSFNLSFFTYESSTVNRESRYEKPLAFCFQHGLSPQVDAGASKAQLSEIGGELVGEDGSSN